MNAKKIEAHGVKGMNSKSWRKSFSSELALEKWVEKNDAVVYGVRDLEETKNHN